MKKTLSERQSKIIQILLKETTFVSAQELSVNLQISMKTIQTEIQEINGLFETAVIESKKGKGYRVLDRERLSESVFIVAKKEENREILILKEILLHGEVEYYKLADSLFISTSTLNKDIKHLNDKISLNFKNLKIVRRNNVLVLNCGEDEKSKLLAYFLLEESENSSFDISVLETYFDTLDVWKIQEVIVQYVKMKQIKITDFNLLSVLLHILILISSEENICENGFALYLKEQTGLSLSSSAAEKAELIFGAKRMRQGEETQSEDILYCKFLKQTFSEIHEIYSIDFEGSEELTEGLVQHFKSLAYRCRTKTQMKNPLLPQFKSSFVLVYDIAVYIATRFFEVSGLRLEEDEICYLAMHVLIALQSLKERSLKIILVNPYGTAVENVIMKHLKEIPDIEFAGNFSFMDYKGIMETKPDLVLSLVELDKKHNLEVYRINNYLNQKEYQAISQRIKLIRVKKAYQNIVVKRCFYEELFMYDCQFVNKEDAIDQMCERLKKYHFVDDQYREEVFERENVAPTCFSNVFAIPHATKKIALKNGICVAILKKPITWNDFEVRIILLFALNSHFDQIPKLYEVLLNTLDDERRCSEILEAKSFDQFMNILFK